MLEKVSEALTLSESSPGLVRIICSCIRALVWVWSTYFGRLESLGIQSRTTRRLRWHTTFVWRLRRPRQQSLASEGAELTEGKGCAVRAVWIAAAAGRSVARPIVAVKERKGRPRRQCLASECAELTEGKGCAVRAVWGSSSCGPQCRSSHCDRQGEERKEKQSTPGEAWRDSFTPESVGDALTSADAVVVSADRHRGFLP